MSDKDLSAVLKSIREKRHLRIGSLSETAEPVEALSTGNLALDAITGVGGLPKGRLIELFGPPSSGKTTTTIQAAARAQQDGERIVYLDYEGAFDPEYCRALGLDPDAESFLFSQPDTMEQGLNALRDVVATGEVAIAIVDSVAAMTTEKELEEDLGEGRFQRKAQLMAQFLRKLTPVARQTGTVVPFINHIATKIDMSPMGARLAAQGIKQVTTPGGEALKFLASVRLQYKQIGKVKGGDDEEYGGSKSSGEKVVVTVVKNKVGPPFRSAEVRLRFGRGFSNVWTAVDILTKKGVVKKGASGVYTFPDSLLPAEFIDGKTIPRGEENLIDAIEASSGWEKLVVRAAREAL